MNPRNVGDDIRKFIRKFAITRGSYVPFDGGIASGQNPKTQIKHDTVDSHCVQGEPGSPKLSAGCGIVGGVGGLVGEEPAIAQESGTNSRIKAGNRAYALKFGGIVINGHGDGRGTNSGGHNSRNG